MVEFAPILERYRAGAQSPGVLLDMDHLTTWGKTFMQSENLHEPEPTILDLPFGTGATGLRIETDSMGEIAVPAEHYWGPQTQRSLQHLRGSHAGGSLPRL